MNESYNPTAHRGKNSPGDTAEEFSHKQDLDVRREEDDEDEGRHGHEVDKHDLAMAVFRREVTVEQRANDVADRAAVQQAGLPGAGELVATLGPGVEAVFLLECWVGEETADEGDVIALHDDGGRHHDGPEHGFLVRLDGLPQTETMLGGRGRPSVLVQDFVVEAHNGVVDVGLLDMVDIVLDVGHRHEEGRYKEHARRRLDMGRLWRSNGTVQDSVDRGF